MPVKGSRLKVKTAP